MHCVAVQVAGRDTSESDKATLLLTEIKARRRNFALERHARDELQAEISEDLASLKVCGSDGAAEHPFIHRPLPGAAGQDRRNLHRYPRHNQTKVYSNAHVHSCVQVHSRANVHRNADVGGCGFVCGL